jgi:hypothetical protein
LHKLTVDEAVAEFHLLLRAELGALPAWLSGPQAPEMHEEAEARYFRCAEALLRLACPDPTRCADQRCRRGCRCRHFADLDARRQGRRRQEPPTRRTPGALALRHAIWVFMNSEG